jgi:hypothetical protein
VTAAVLEEVHYYFSLVPSPSFPLRMIRRSKATAQVNLNQSCVKPNQRKIKLVAGSFQEKIDLY